MDTYQNKYDSFYSPHDQNLHGLHHQKIIDFINKKCQECETCNQNKVYKCMEPACFSSKLICPACDVYKASGRHFTHSYSYILPFFKDYELYVTEESSKYTQQVLNLIYEIKASIRKSLQQVEKIQKFVNDNFLDTRQLFEKTNIHSFIEKVKNSKSVSSLDEIFQNVEFFNFKKYLERYSNIFQQFLSKHGLSSPVDEPFQQTLNKFIQDKINAFSKEKKFQIKIPFTLSQYPQEFINFSRMSENSINYAQIYTNSLSYTNREVHIQNEKQLQEFQVNIGQFLKSRHLKIVSSISWKSDKTPRKFNKQYQSNSNLKLLNISGDEHFMKKILAIFTDFQNIEAISLKSTSPFQNTIDEFLPRNLLSIQAKIQVKPSNPYESFFIYCFNNTNLRFINLNLFTSSSSYFSIYRKDEIKKYQNLKTKYLLKFISQEHPKLLHLKLSNIDFESVGGNADDISSRNFKKGLCFDIPTPNQRIENRVKQVKKQSIQRRRIMCVLSKNHIHRTFLSNPDGALKFYQFYEAFLV